VTVAVTFFLSVERAKRFVNVHLHCIVSNLNRMQNVDVVPLETFLRTPIFPRLCETALALLIPFAGRQHTYVWIFVNSRRDLENP